MKNNLSMPQIQTGIYKPFNFKVISKRMFLKSIALYTNNFTLKMEGTRQ
ncbi:MAG: hypothetical protein JXR46_07115 [Calditrichaceae bacterium]|nr:hypothetical protein [Calditrichaceae bacterium]